MNKKKINELEVHPLASMFPGLNDREQQELENSIKKIGLQNDITLYEDKILDGVHRNKACIKVGVQPRYKRLPEGLSAELFVLAKNLHRRHLNPAQRVNIALEFREKRQEKINSEQKLIEKLEKENKNDILIQNALRIRENKVNEKIAKSFGTKPESIRQGIVIKKIAKKDPKIAADWEDALKGRTSIEDVYRKATKMKEEKGKKEKRKKSTLIENNELTEQNRKLTEKLSNLGHLNQLIKEKFNRLVQALKKILTDVTKDTGDIEKKYTQLLEKLENLIDEINNPSKKTLFYTPPADLRKAELKLN